MCEKCGCSNPKSHRREGAAAHTHSVSHTHAVAELSHNDRLAERNRGFFLAKRVFVVNLLSFPGAGVHAFVDRTAAEYGPRRRLKVVTADYLESIHAIHNHDGANHYHAPAADPDSNQHLDAHAIAHALDHLDLDHADVVFLVNSGSAASQAVHDLGETVRVPLLSVRNGEAKPLKFPRLFDGAAAVVVNEIDQAAAYHFDLPKGRAGIAQVAPHAQVFEVAPATGDGMEAWYEFLETGLREIQS